jgi:ComF family protein
MIHTWNTFLDFIFPPSPAAVILRAHKHVSVTRYYEETRLLNDVALSHYHAPFIAASITAGKFEGNLEALERLAPLIHEYLTRHSLPLATTIVVPIPLHPTRLRERDYNQINIILQQLQKNIGLQVVPLLIRTRATKTQSHLERSTRLTNIEGAFAYRARTLPFVPTHILVVDDVVTTGSTLKAARAAILPHLTTGTSLITLAVAH